MTPPVRDPLPQQMNEKTLSKLHSRPVRVLMRGVFALTFLMSLLACSADDVSSNIMHRLIERSRLIASSAQSNQYIYEKHSRMEELDEKDHVTKSTEKLYRVVLIGGLSFPRLVKVQGKDLTPQQLEKENQREQAFRRQVTRVDVHKKAKDKEGLITTDIVNKFEFKFVRRELVNGRTNVVLTFAAPRGAPEKTIEERIYKRSSGTLWVDEEDAELTKLDAGVRGPIPLGWLGAVGSLDKLQLMFDRLRMPDGVWVNRKNVFLLDARKLFTRMRYRTTEESTGFRREQTNLSPR